MPNTWIEAIHAKLHLRYPQQWSTAIEGLDEDALITEWQNVLTGLTGLQVKYGLDMWTGDFPPNVQQFRKLCKAAPEQPPQPANNPRLEQKPVSAETVKRNFKAVKQAALEGNHDQKPISPCESKPCGDSLNFLYSGWVKNIAEFCAKSDHGNRCSKHGENVSNSEWKKYRKIVTDS